MRCSAIVLSAGKGKRMGGDIPKQYMLLKGKPVLYYTLHAFEKSQIDEIIIVCAKGDENYVKKDIVVKYNISKVVSIVPGGAERFDSVYQGLKAVTGDYVFIHDGARCFVDQETIASCMENVIEKKACLAGMPVKDTIKVVDTYGNVVETPDRRTLWLAQTPQCFETQLVKSSYEKMFSYYEDANIDRIQGAPKSIAGITDDAMVVDIFGNVNSFMVESSYNNIKLTTPEDMLFGEMLV